MIILKKCQVIPLNTVKNILKIIKNNRKQKKLKMKQMKIIENNNPRKKRKAKPKPKHRIAKPRKQSLSIWKNRIDHIICSTFMTIYTVK